MRARLLQARLGLARDARAQVFELAGLGWPSPEPVPRVEPVGAAVRASWTHLIRQFRRAVGLTPGQYVRRLGSR